MSNDEADFCAALDLLGQSRAYLFSFGRDNDFARELLSEINAFVDRVCPPHEEDKRVLEDEKKTEAAE